MKKNTKNSRSVPIQTAPSIGYILSPRIDFWMTGGISIIVMCLLLVYAVAQGGAATTDKSALIGSALIFQALINWPHFMGSYSLLYRPIENLRKYPLATIYVPMALLLGIAVAVAAGEQGAGQGVAVNQDVATFLWLGAAFYLAWHYTGQAWGMIATFSRLSHVELTASERSTVRIGLRTLLVWHVVWGAQDLPERWLGGLHAYVPDLLSVMNVVCIFAFAAGLVVWYNVRTRIARMPDARILASWLSIYLWYLVLFFMPGAYLFVQFSHALQYLAFPLRMELNRNVHQSHGGGETQVFQWGARYYAMLLVSGLVVFYLPEYASDHSTPFTLALVVASAVSIHHYFVDSCIWKISNPDVRRNLFAHLVPARQ
jgi:hypothetical protein